MKIWQYMVERKAWNEKTGCQFVGICYNECVAAFGDRVSRAVPKELLIGKGATP